MRRALYVFWQSTWGILQSFVGLFIFLYYIKYPHFRYQGAWVTIWPLPNGSMSMGRFLFLYPGWTPENQKLLAHEYGHTIQSLLLGPLYLLVIGIPSFAWAALPYFKRLRREKGVAYSALYTERWADYNGARYAHKPKKLPPAVAAARKGA